MDFSGPEEDVAIGDGLVVKSELYARFKLLVKEFTVLHINL